MAATRSASSRPLRRRRRRSAAAPSGPPLPHATSLPAGRSRPSRCAVPDGARRPMPRISTLNPLRPRGAARATRRGRTDERQLQILERLPPAWKEDQAAGFTDREPADHDGGVDDGDDLDPERVAPAEQADVPRDRDGAADRRMLTCERLDALASTGHGSFTSGTLSLSSSLSTQFRRPSLSGLAPSHPYTSRMLSAHSTARRWPTTLESLSGLSSSASRQKSLSSSGSHASPSSLSPSVLICVGFATARQLSHASPTPSPSPSCCCGFLTRGQLSTGYLPSQSRSRTSQAWHVPVWQSGVAALQTRPQAPQLVGSASRFAEVMAVRLPAES